MALNSRYNYYNYYIIITIINQPISVHFWMIKFCIYHWERSYICRCWLRIVFFYYSNTEICGLVWKMVNTWPKKFLCYPLSKIGVFGFLISWISRKKTRNKKSWFLVNSRCFCFAFHATLMPDGKKRKDLNFCL